MYYDLTEYEYDADTWTEVETDNDIKNFLEKFSFYESYIESVVYESGTRNIDERSTIHEATHNMIITFGSCWGSRVEVFFRKVRKFSLQGFYNNLFGNEIDDCYLKFHTDLWGKTCDSRVIVWADYFYFSPQDFCEHIDLKNENITFVIADGMKWRFVND